MNNARFKIDFRDSIYRPYGLYFKKSGWLSSRWVSIGDFESIKDARDHYEAIKDLPEYLP